MLSFLQKVSAASLQRKLHLRSPWPPFWSPGPLRFVRSRSQCTLHMHRAVLTTTLAPAQIVISCTKGILTDTLETVNQVLQRVLPSQVHQQLAYLSGPSFAAEVSCNEDCPQPRYLLEYWIVTRCAGPPTTGLPQQTQPGSLCIALASCACQPAGSCMLRRLQAEPVHWGRAVAPPVKWQ